MAIRRKKPAPFYKYKDLIGPIRVRHSGKLKILHQPEQPEWVRIAKSVCVGFLLIIFVGLSIYGVLIDWPQSKESVATAFGVCLGLGIFLGLLQAVSIEASGSMIGAKHDFPVPKEDRMSAYLFALIGLPLLLSVGGSLLVGFFRAIDHLREMIK